MRQSLTPAALVLAALVPAAAAQQVRQLTLAEAVQRALDVQPAVVQARGTVSNAGWQKRAAYGAFLPTLTLGSTAFRQNTPSIVNGLSASAGTYQYSSSLALSLDLFTGFRRLARYRNADATRSEEHTSELQS